MILALKFNLWKSLILNSKFLNSKIYFSGTKTTTTYSDVVKRATAESNSINQPKSSSLSAIKSAYNSKSDIDITDSSAVNLSAEISKKSADFSQNSAALGVISQSSISSSQSASAISTNCPLCRY